MNKTLIYICIFILIYSCSEKSINGIYFSGARSITIKEDSSFRYFEGYTNSNHSDGKIKMLDKNKMLIYSWTDILNIPITAYHIGAQQDKIIISNDGLLTPNKNFDKFFVVVNDSFRYPIYFNDSNIVNDTIYNTLNKKGVNSIYVEWINSEPLFNNYIKTNKYYMQNNDSNNSIRIVTNFANEYLGYKTILSDTLKINKKHNILYWHSEKLIFKKK